MADDVYAAAPAWAVFPAVARFVQRLSELSGLECQWAKFSCFSHDYDLTQCPLRDAAGIPVGGVTLPGGGFATGAFFAGRHLLALYSSTLLSSVSWPLVGCIET